MQWSDPYRSLGDLNMARGKRLNCPKIIVRESAITKFATYAEAWENVGPVIARLLAGTISQCKKYKKSATLNDVRSD